MKNIKFSRLFAAVMVVACLAFVGCKPQTEEETVEKVIVVKQLSAEDGIAGKWSNDNESWNTYNGYGCNYLPTKIETASYGVQTGTVYIQETSDTSGYIYYKFSADMTGYGPAPDYTPFTVNCAGKWGAVAYKNLTADSVQMCDAFKTYDFAETLADAVKMYTVKNGWFEGIESGFHKVN